MITATGWEDVLPAAIAYERREPEYRGEALSLLGERGCVTIVDRTYNQHLDKHGSQFTPYNPSFTYVVNEGDDYYEKAHQAGGRYNPKDNSISFDGGYEEFKAGLETEVPNLAVKGRLLGVIDNEGNRPFDVTAVDAPAWKVEVGWTRGDLADIADKHIEGTGVHQRDFWGFAEESNQKEWDEFNDFLVDRYDEFLTVHFEAAGWL